MKNKLRTRAESLREQQETKTQYDKVQGRLESIDRFVGHPPSGFTEKQIASVVRAMVKPTSKQSSEQPEVSQLLARQLAALSQDISDFEQDRKKGEDAFPPIDPSIPEGKSNEPWMIRQRYYGETKGKFHFARLDSRCGHLMEALSPRADLVDDVTTVEIMCQRDARQCYRFEASVYLRRGISGKGPAACELSGTMYLCVEISVAYVGRLPNRIAEHRRGYESEPSEAIQLCLASVASHL